MGDQRSVLSSDELWRELLEAAGTVLRVSDVLAGRGVNVWRNPRLHNLARRLLVQKAKTEKTVQDGQMMMSGFEAPLPEPVLKQLQKAVREGNPEVKFPVGTEIADKWINTMTKEIYDAPLRIVDYRAVRLANGQSGLGAVLLRTVATPFRVQFDEADTAYCNGSNRLSIADMLLWLNSEALMGNWWYAQHDCDVEPATARERGGYLAGCSLELQEVLSEIVLKVPAEEAVEEGFDEMRCRVFLPSPEMLNIDLSGRNLARCPGAWKHYRNMPTHPDTSCLGRVCRNDKGEPQRYWTLWPRPGIYHNHLWMITPDGSADFSNASAAYAVVAAFVVA